MYEEYVIQLILTTTSLFCRLFFVNELLLPVDFMIITVINQRLSLESSNIQQLLGQDCDMRNVVYIFK